MATKYAPRHRHRRVLPLRFLPAICALCLLLGFLLGRGVQALSVGDPLSAETMGADAKDWVRPEGACLTSGTLILVSNEVPFSFPEEQALCTVLEEKNDCYLVRDSTVQLGAGGDGGFEPVDGGLSRPRREQDCERGGGAPDGGVSAAPL